MPIEVEDRYGSVLFDTVHPSLHRTTHQPDLAPAGKGDLLNLLRACPNDFVRELGPSRSPEVPLPTRQTTVALYDGK